MSASAEHAAATVQATLANIPTNDLIAELATRENIACYTVGEEEAYLIRKTSVEDRAHSILEQYEGPVRILTVVD